MKIDFECPTFMIFDERYKKKTFCNIRFFDKNEACAKCVVHILKHHKVNLVNEREPDV